MKELGVVAAEAGAAEEVVAVVLASIRVSSESCNGRAVSESVLKTMQKRYITAGSET